MVMLHAGFVGTGVTVQSASLAGYRRVLVWKMARRVGNAPTFPGFGVLCIACLPPPFLGEQPGRLHHIGKSAFYHPGAQRRPRHHTLSPESGHYLPSSVPLDGRSPSRRRSRSAKKNEHRCHARDGPVSVHRWRRTRRCFTADVSVFMAHLPGKPFGSVKLGQKSPSFLALA